MPLKYLALVALALLPWIGHAEPAVTTDARGKVTGVTGLAIAGNTYELRFESFGESFQDAFGGDPDMRSKELARVLVAAAAAVLNQDSVLNSDIAGNPVTSTAEDTNLLLPFGTSYSKVVFYELDWKEPDAWREKPVGPAPVGVDASQPDTAWIRVSRAP
jgi:hypothetical protein